MWIKDRNVQIGRILMAGCFQLAPWIYSPALSGFILPVLCLGKPIYMDYIIMKSLNEIR